MSDMTSSQASQSNVNFNTGEAYVVPIESEQTDVTQPSVYSQKQVQDSMSTSTDKSTTQTTYSTDPNSPAVSPSDATTASNTTSSSNAWFNPSFLAAFNAIMMFVLTMETKNNFMEAETERTYQKVAIDMGKSVSQLVKAAALNQAEQKMTEAISSFVQAGISGAQALTVMGNTAKAEKEADLQIKTQQTKIEQLGKTKQTFATDNAKDQPYNDAQKTKVETWNEGVDKNIAKEQRALDSMVANKTAKVMELTHGYNILTNSKFDALKSLTEGTEKSLNSFAMVKYGEIEGLREMTETYRRAAQTVAETAGKGRDSNKSNFNSMLQQWNDIIHKTMQAHSLRS